MTVILIGYMGSGKSAIGKKIAKKSKINLVDLDDYIEENEGMSITEIFEKKGEVYFRKKEREYLKQLLETETNKIVSLGGGTPCYGDNMEMILKATPYVFYLKASVDTLYKRLKKRKDQRPLIKNIDNADLSEFIRKHLFERNFYYMQSHHIVNVDGKSRKKIAKKVIKKLS
ncbi:shikimate kinase [Abyssalbus ytuae]|uniref:Shikimate kinase n=1 Tax=Abyssalbus ytuae TaxID=2926907 RepID=A0A9E7D2M1_9FLAO|nr:shikimate kinase [Abyssalbus ytuae]UOB18293.1 shikimate kinase [Abyssalbus ytuae]